MAQYDQGYNLARAGLKCCRNIPNLRKDLGKPASNNIIRL